MNEEAKRQIARDKSRHRVKIATYIILAIAALLAVYIYIQSIPPPNGMYDAFAKCIANTGTKFYGAFWCPHCAAQKAEFGDSEQYLPYVECSPGEGLPQNQICTDNGVQNYPTWVFPDGSRLSGTTPLDQLAAKTGCALPGQAGSSTTPMASSTEIGSSTQVVSSSASASVKL